MQRRLSSSTWSGLALVLAVALAWRLMLFFALRDTPLAFWHTWDQSDMHSFCEQARALAGGDWLARMPYHPYHEWMKVAPPEVWAKWFLSKAFYQAPLYSYFLALLMRLGLDAALWARLIQVGLGTACCGLAYGLTRRLFGRRAGVAAGLLMAVYGPLVAIESQLLRETLILFVTFSILWIFTVWNRRVGLGLAGLNHSITITSTSTSTKGRHTHPSSNLKPLLLTLLAGLGLGVLTMLHEGAFLLAFSVGAVGAWRLRRLGWGAAARWLGLLGVGWLAGYAPLLARNLLMGAPPLPRFSGSAFAWAVANQADAPYGGALWVAPSREFARTINFSGGRVPALLSAVFATYKGEWWRWLGHWGERGLALWTGAENNENICYAYFKIRVPVLAFFIDFRVLMPLALAGAALWGGRRWRRAVRRGSPAVALLLNFLLVSAMISAVLPLGRYRLMGLPFLLPFAGRALVGLWAALRAQRWRRLALQGGCVAAFALVQLGLDAWFPFGLLRPADFGVASTMYRSWGRPDLAARELEDGIKRGVDTPEMNVALAQIDEALGKEDEAARIYRQVLEGARKAGQPELARQIEARLELYRQGRPGLRPARP